jgi:hypothetical protein
MPHKKLEHENEQRLQRSSLVLHCWAFDDEVKRIYGDRIVTDDDIDSQAKKAGRAQNSKG